MKGAGYNEPRSRGCTFCRGFPGGIFMISYWLYCIFTSGLLECIVGRYNLQKREKLDKLNQFKFFFNRYKAVLGKFFYLLLYVKGAQIKTD